MSIKQLADEWETQEMPILFYQLFPKEYTNMEKKIYNLINKDHGIATSYLASFIKELIPELLKYINVRQLYDGLYDIAKYISNGYDKFVMYNDDFQDLRKYIPKQKLSKESKKILLSDMSKGKKTEPEIIESTIKNLDGKKNVINKGDDSSSFEKMTVVQLKEYMRTHNIKPLGGLKAELIARIKEFQKIGTTSNIIYENDIKITPVYIQKEETKFEKMKVVELKQMLKQNGLKVSGKKSELIQRLIDAGVYKQLPERSQSVARQEPKKTWKQRLAESGLLKLKKSKPATPKPATPKPATPKPATPKPVTPTISPITLPVNIPKGKTSMLNRQMQMISKKMGDTLINFPTPKPYTVSKYTSDNPEEGTIMKLSFNPKDNEEAQLLASRQQFPIEDFFKMLPVDYVKDILNKTKKNVVIFPSTISSKLYYLDKPTMTNIMMNKLNPTRIFRSKTTIYGDPGWTRDIEVQNDEDKTFAMVYNRIITPEQIYDKFNLLNIQNMFELNKKNLDDIFTVTFLIPEFKGTILDRSYRNSPEGDRLDEENKKIWSIFKGKSKKSKMLWRAVVINEGLTYINMYPSKNSKNEQLTYKIVDGKILEL
jgi:hypothetical protein